MTHPCKKLTVAFKPAALAALVLLAAITASADPASGQPAGDVRPDAFPSAAAPFLQSHCVKCHGPEDPDGELSLHALTGDLTRERLTWALVLERVEAGEMPPRKSPRPPAADVRAFTDWLKSGLNVAADAPAGRQPALPRDGNLVPHEALFGPPLDTPTEDAPAGPVRLWRLRPEAYLGFVRDVYRGRLDNLTQPFSTIAERGFKDYADLYHVDGATTEILVRNAEQIVLAQTAHEVKDGKVSWKGDTVKEFKPLFDPDRPPTAAELETALRAQFRLATAPDPSAEDLAGLVGLYERSLEVADRTGAARNALAAVLLRPEAVYRMELGDCGGQGRAMLSPREVAQAVSLALGDRRDTALFAAAAKGELGTREQVAAHVRRILDDPKAEKPRLLKFFREYFEYDLAPDVFKDKPADFIHRPEVLVADTDRLVLHVLAEDRDVLAELLTTRRSFVNYSEKEDKKTRTKRAAPREVAHPINDKGRRSPEGVYGLGDCPASQAAELPDRQTAGILTQPSWLVAHSTNFDNDPVRRGRWVRERLLGGHVPQLPIGVAAQVPDERHRTLRDRLGVTRAAECWRCHRKMDDLGLAFEEFDHLGKFRTAESVLDPEATARNVDKKGKPLGPVHRDVPLDASGFIADSGDTTLDGSVSGAVEMIHKAAKSERVRQVFVRHAFRFFLGRNETVADGKTLREADAAYARSGGSFKALVTSLLTSDSFLYRTTPDRATATPPNSEQPEGADR